MLYEVITHADELHQFKLEFFTNISHELKTPLTLILAPIRKLMEEEKMNPAFRRQLNGIERNANRLFHVITSYSIHYTKLYDVR